MMGTDDSILELLEESGVALSPKALDVNLGREGISVSKRTIHRRIVRLEGAGLIEKVDKKAGYYAITDKGRAYLSGELDAKDLEL